MDTKAKATEIVKKLVDEGYIAYFAGGWVRDYMMGHPSADIDIATDAPPEKIVELFPRTLKVGISFGVVVVIKDGHQFEVSTFRRDLDYQDGRRPEQIEWTNPYEDAIRRDFTINGMFYDPLENVVHDFVHGAEDIEKQVIKAIGNPYERFMEDRLRMIRAVRFATRFGFNIEQETQEAIKSNADFLFPAVAMERVWQELNKMSNGSNFGHALIELHRLELLAVIFPKLKGMHLNDLKHIVADFEQFPKDTPTILYLVQLFPEITSAESQDMAKYLKASNKDLKLLEIWHWAKKIAERQCEKVELVKFYAEPSSELCLELLAQTQYKDHKNEFLKQHHEQRKALKVHINRIIDRQPLLTSKELQQNGIAPGKTMGELLKEGERLSINENLSHSDEVVKKLKSLSLWPK